VRPGHPDVADVRVIGVPDARLGEEIMAWIRLHPGSRPLTAADVRAYAQGQLAHYTVVPPEPDGSGCLTRSKASRSWTLHVYVVMN
jgi:acyl-CoA synthetase (AMP-forming)/AMP-acid ligase II